MRVVVLGSGVVGVTTAYYLAAEGHETVVIDRQPKAGLETSYANAGLIAPGHVYSWASPRAPKILLQSLWRSDAALKFRLKADPRLWLWSLRFLANCTAARNRANTLRKLSLCLYSQAQLAELARDTAVEYHAIRKGLLYLPDRSSLRPITSGFWASSTASASIISTRLPTCRFSASDRS